MMKIKFTSMFLVLLFVYSCVSSPLGSSDAWSTDDSWSTDDDTWSTDDNTWSSNDFLNDTGTGDDHFGADMSNKAEDVFDTDDWSDYPDDSSLLVGTDYTESSTDPNVMEAPDDEDDETDDDQESQVNERLTEFLKKPNKSESDILSLVRSLLTIVIEKAPKHPRFAAMRSKILDILNSPEVKEDEIWTLVEDFLKYGKDADDSDDSVDDLTTTVAPTQTEESEVVETETDQDTTSSPVSPEVVVDEEDSIDIPEDIANSLDFLKDPTVPKALEATKELQSEQCKNTTLESGSGYKFLNMIARFSHTKKINKNFLVRLVRRDLNEFMGVNEKLTDIVTTLGDYVDDDTRDDFLFSVASEISAGHVQALFVSYKKRDDGQYDLKRAKFSGKARLGATVIITRVATGNSTHSESKDIISYLPGGSVTKQEITELLFSMLPELGKLLHNLS